MANPTNLAVHEMIPMRQLRWSPGEKAAAQRAFDGGSGGNSMP
jgi:hypothetical protein